VKKIFFFCLALIAIFFFLGKELSPLDSRFFLVHDNTQGARIQEFALNLQKGIIPPRLAPDFSFQHGFPVFNFYAPVSYWIGAFFKLIGLSTVISLKLVFYLGLSERLSHFFSSVLCFLDFGERCLAPLSIPHPCGWRLKYLYGEIWAKYGF